MQTAQEQPICGTPVDVPVPKKRMFITEVMIAFRANDAIMHSKSKARMLTLLKIKNLALVDQLLWEPSSGFICITGETGAGKSVIIGAIRLALGERADKTLIRSGEQQCSVEAVFHLPESSPVHAILNEHGVPPCEDGNLIIKRLISSTANRQFLNDSPCTLNLLREAGACLVDMHGPSDHRSLVSQERQLSLLDAFGEHAPLVHAYSDAWRQWQDARRAYDDLEHAEAATAREIELLRHQVDEIDSAAFTPEEVLTLEERWQRARNGTRLREQVSKMLSMLEETDVPGLGTQLRELTRAAHELERMDASTAAWLAPLAGVNLELKEIEGRLADYSAELDCDPRELFQLEERINLLESLKMKYGPSFEDVCSRREEAASRLDRIEHRTERLEELRASIAVLRKQMDAAGQALTRARQDVFEVSLSPLQEPGSQGMETVEFLFGPNPGEPSKPLRLIASSGELARIMLAIKSALAHKDATPLLVFDEIDANVGGEVARAVGFKMQQLGNRHQVISITHFPQVAALASHHYLVQKASAGNRTISCLREVSHEERVDELVRMLGGGGDHARTLAQALLQPS